MINNSKTILATIVALLLLVHFGLSANAQSGVIFDDVTGDVITGTEVTLQYEPITGSGNWFTQLATDTPPYSGGTGAAVITPTPPGGTTGTNPQTIGDFGFSWGAAEGLTFRLAVSATGYTFPASQTTWNITWDSFGYTNTASATAFRGGSFIQPPVPVTIDIPVSVAVAATSGSSGKGGNDNPWKCGYLGIEPLLLMGLIILIRRKKSG